MINIRIDTLGNVVKVYSNSDLLFSFRAGYASETNVCNSCNMNDFCEKRIFGTQYGFRELVCQKLGIKRRPEVTLRGARILSLGIRGKIIKKSLRK